MKTFQLIALTALLAAGFSGCGDENQPAIAVTPIVDTGPVVVDPSATPTQPTPTPTATPIASATPCATPYLIQWKKPHVWVSPKATFGLDVRNWIARGNISSSNADITIVSIEEKLLAGFTKVVDAHGRWVGITGARILGHKPGDMYDVILPITIRNGDGIENKSRARVSLVYPFVEFQGFGGFKIKKAAGTLEFNMARLKDRQLIEASDEVVTLNKFRSNLPLTNCVDVTNTAGGKIGIRCDKGALDSDKEYGVWLEAGIVEGASVKQSFYVRPIKGLEDEGVEP